MYVLMRPQKQQQDKTQLLIILFCLCNNRNSPSVSFCFIKPKWQFHRLEAGVCRCFITLNCLIKPLQLLVQPDRLVGVSVPTPSAEGPSFFLPSTLNHLKLNHSKIVSHLVSKVSAQ